jgi:uncharacterized protein (TIGR02996 family)
MSSHESFLEALKADPGDDVTRLVYADWLEEQGDARGEFLRLEVELSRLPDHDERYPALEEELAHRREPLSPEWVKQAGKHFDVVLYGHYPSAKIHVIKLVRELAGVGLVVSKNMVEILPACIRNALPRQEAEVVRARLQEPWSGQPERAADVVLLPTSYHTPDYAVHFLSAQIKESPETLAQRDDAYRRVAAVLGKPVDTIVPPDGQEHPTGSMNRSFIVWQEAAAFGTARALIEAGQPIIMLHLHRLPALPYPPAPHFADYPKRRAGQPYRSILQDCREADRAFVASVLAQIENVSRDEAMERLNHLPLLLPQSADQNDAFWMFRRFRGRARVTVEPVDPVT